MPDAARGRRGSLRRGRGSTNARPAHRQESVTAWTVFDRTRTALAKWFLAAYLMGRDKRGVSAVVQQREQRVAYQTAWTMAHKLRHGLSED
jgi:hypothetical protein